MGELGFSMSDLYPNFGGVDTSTMANPEADDQEALNEDTKVASEASSKEARGKNILLAMVVLVGLVVFFGGK
jgi:hypothetical protein